MTLMLGKKNSNLLIILFALCLNGKAQIPTNYRSKLDSLRKKDSIHARLTTEIGGIAKVYSINFKKYWYTKNRRTYGFSIGFSSLPLDYYHYDATFNRDYQRARSSGLSSSPNAFSNNQYAYVYIVPVSFFHSIGNKNKWELDYGASLSYSKEGQVTKPYETIIPKEFYLKWSFGVLRRFSPEKFDKRITLCLGFNIQSYVDIGLTKNNVGINPSILDSPERWEPAMYSKISIDYSF